ncbi:MAG: metallophosphoesterase [Candidatus Woesearchaeota archaeon]|jgi:DNA polymerase II small subunit
MESLVIKNLINKGVLISPEVMSMTIDEKIILEIENYYKNELAVLDVDLINNFIKNIKNKKGVKESKVKILKSYDGAPKKRSFQDFVSVFNLRFKNLSQMLKNRKELQNVTSISRVNSKTSNDKVAVIGMILEKSTTKNNNIVIKLEDQTGICIVILRNDEKNKELFALATNLVLDEVIGVTGTWLNTAVFADKIIFPDVPLNKELKKQKEEEYVVLLGDTHFGSKSFMEQEFSKFILWIQGKLGNEEQKNIAEKTKYLILTGDIVEGVGIYPGQQNDLSIMDITEQYEHAAKWLKQIPEHIKLILMSGNHDAGRLSEPQEVPFKDYAASIWAMPNVTLVSNPAYVNISSTDDFPGFDLLLYHGGSLIYYSENVPAIREAGGQKRSDLILKFLLQKRHLAPTHGSTLYLPDAEHDFLLIDIIPDIFITGHIHRSTVGSYRNVTTVNASCWTETSEDQIKRGLEPLPARVPVINLKTRDVKIMNFLSKKSKEKEEEKLKIIQNLKEMK